MNGSTPEARKSLFVKQASFGGLSPAAPESEGGAVGGLSDTKNGVRGMLDVGGREGQENIGEGRNLFTEGIFALSCRGEVEKVRSLKIVFKNMDQVETGGLLRGGKMSTRGEETSGQHP